MMIEQLARRVLQELKTAFPTHTSDLPEKELRSLLENTLRKLNLVSREEFDAQHAVLLRTREKLEVLEREVAALESEMNAARDSNPASGSGD